ncbi:MAG: glucose-6-phosphate isomerase [Leucobacter sp.]|nr:glucose-6-phosphate isomerase [Leucobacter sp.]
MTLAVTGERQGEAFANALASLLNTRFASRLFAQDATLWGEAAAAEAAVRLGWTDFAENARELVSAAGRLADEFRAAGIDRFVLCGMGGSSLAPLVIAPDLTVLDSTHPGAVRAALGGDLSRTAVIVSSKSGGTVETLSHLAAFESAFIGAGIAPDTRIVFVTDPESKLADFARVHGNRVFLADPSVGGRFSALTAFGIVPSVLAGANVSKIVDDAIAARSEFVTDTAENPALRLASALAAGLPERFLLELHPDGGLPAELGLWIEQLVAESTGKDGRGVLPIALPAGAAATAVPSVETLYFGAQSDPAANGRNADVADGVTRSGLTVTGSLGEQMLLWQVATAALGFLMGVDPFNQPDVEAAKVASRATLEENGSESGTANVPRASDVAADLLLAAPDGGYVSIQAYVDPNEPDMDALLEELRATLSARLGAAVAVGYGPRYLHSTGQLHKGGPASAAFLQLIGLDAPDVNIPSNEREVAGSPTFGELLLSQARGDASVLRDRGRAVVTVETADIRGFVRDLLAAV